MNAPMTATEAQIKLSTRIDNCYLLYYRVSAISTLTKGFYWEGGIEKARERARKHCEVMKYKYLFIRPLISDLVLDEEHKLLGKSDDSIY